MIKNIKIAHISDLHCDSTKKGRWIENFKPVKDFILKGNNHIDIVLLTGDCVEDPTQDNFDLLASELKEFEEQEGLQLISVPGNHDLLKDGIQYSAKQLALFAFGKKLEKSKLPFSYNQSNDSLKIDEETIETSKLFQKNENKLLIPQGHDIKDILKSIYDIHKIAIFPFDSNVLSSLLLFAQGEVAKPHERFNKWQDFYLEISKELNIDYSLCFKIALLHHHLLPLKSDTKDKLEEGFLILQNSNEFLKASIKFNIDLILHGHKHLTGYSRYRPSDPNGNWGNPIIVSSCGTSSKVGNPNFEIKLYEISPTGVCYGESHNLKENDEEWLSSRKKKLIAYRDIRQRNYRNFDWKEKKARIKKMRGFRKYVNIFEDGKVNVTVFHDLVEWNQHLDPKDIYLEGSYNTNIGRIEDIKHSFGKGYLSEKCSESPNEIKRGSEPNEVDEVATKFDFKGKLNFSEDIINVKTTYTIYNGFALNKREHEEAYFEPKSGPMESSTLAIETLMDYCELIIHFPHGKDFQDTEHSSNYFPDYQAIFPTVTSIKGDSNGKAVAEEESQYLENNNGVKIIPELNQISLYIDVPQPNMKYSLNWRLKDTQTNFRDCLNATEKETYEYIEENFEGKNSTFIDEFFNSFKQTIKKSLPGIDLYLMSYSKKTKKLTLLNNTVEESFKNDEKIKIEPLQNVFELMVGRGISGKAFKSRGVERWQKTTSKGESNDAHKGFKTRFEQIWPGIPCNSVISIPLTSKVVFPDKTWPEDVDHGAFGVISLLSTNSTKLKKYFDCDDEEERIKYNGKFVRNLHNSLISLT
jgi:predicted MPP superfamily phosphohydrolase